MRTGCPCSQGERVAIQATQDMIVDTLIDTLTAAESFGDLPKGQTRYSIGIQS